MSKFFWFLGPYLHKLSVATMPFEPRVLLSVANLLKTTVGSYEGESLP